MKAKNSLLIALAAVAIGLSTGSALARDRDDDGYRHGKHRHHHHHHHWKHHHGHYYGPVVRERVVVERPVYVDRYVQYAPPARDPAIVLSVDLPPLVFPLR